MISMDFQEATAERILEVYRKLGQNRVLLADEVGLGKTIIAKLVIKKVGQWHKEEKHDDHFKVIYICSNINIANQNAKKLGIKDTLNVSESRLSMQHLKIYQTKGLDHEYEQLIPMTPATSFTMTSGCGNKEERALMYVHLLNLPCFSDIRNQLSLLMAYEAQKYWKETVEDYKEKVKLCNTNGSNYKTAMKEILTNALTPAFIEEIRANCLSSSDKKSDNRMIINKLRKIFAQISLDELDPDLVIMDEFQRFKDLITPSDDEQGMLSRQFLSDPSRKVLLLSATPYKPYSTLEEISQADGEDHYKEFMEVMDFIFYDNEKKIEFKEVWRDYSESLSELDAKDLTLLVAHKLIAENAMYEGVCRTERFSTGIIDDSQATEVQISEKDILSFCEAQSLLDKINEVSKKKLKNHNIPMDYIKSSPYLLSFMENYQLKKEIEDYFDGTKKYEMLKSLKHQTLLLKKDMIQTYKEIPSNNARLEKLKETVFADRKNDVDKLLWVPASRPYYRTISVFDKNKNFSKVLVFSSWEMVPRMIAAMLSYEAEQRTIGALYIKEFIKRGKGYFTAKDENRYGTARLKKEAAELVTYPSKFLADLYNPLKYMDQDIGSILRAIKQTIQVRIDEISGQFEIEERGSAGAKVMLDLLEILDGNTKISIQSIPEDAAERLALMAIGSPGVCAKRLLIDAGFAKLLAEKFVALFNKPESAAILDLLYGKSEDTYYENVFKYCVDGNMQAMLDEYAHILDEHRTALFNDMTEGFADTSSVQVDTIESFIEGIDKPRIRTHFAVGYFNSVASDKNVQRTANIRKAFNSPFRPFVLATTSIGQEGLDFHFYCRKIMHWNTPSNPVDLEQREGRINRYKCLAVRQNIAAKYKDEYTWKGMFKKASELEKGEHSDLVPYWCLTDTANSAVKIERIIPMYPLSQDRVRYERLIKILSLYRLTLGQPRQEELVEALIKEKIDQIGDQLYINLSPIRKIIKKHV
ncbi:MAG: helicase-related protein [Eubacteriales bacterium]